MKQIEATGGVAMDMDIWMQPPTPAQRAISHQQIESLIAYIREQQDAYGAQQCDTATTPVAYDVARGRMHAVDVVHRIIRAADSYNISKSMDRHLVELQAKAEHEVAMIVAIRKILAEADA